ncbi:hypothetical protein [Rhodoplanes elegans]|uniref:hypothetical protein n=1 Tax=Rhodoplanes elegans TaxID=29408 RepID=UPI0011B938A7|nr:hypothetical protein [Rhodoplanes elegans]
MAFLVNDERLFTAIQKIAFNDYKGKFVVYYDRERRGRMFDFYEGGARGPKYRFAFADLPDEIATDNLTGSILDTPLLQVFTKRVLGEPANGQPAGLPQPAD